MPKKYKPLQNNLIRRAFANCTALLFCLMALYAIGFSTDLHAADDRYEVEIIAPEPLDELLQNHLEIIKWRENPRMTPPEWQRLYRAATKNIQDLLATEGYFSPAISASMEEATGSHLAKFRIDPGSPTLVRQVDLKFRGEITRQSADVTPSLETLRADWLLPVDKPFRQEDWALAKRRLLSGLLVARYPNASIRNSRAEIDSKTNTAILSVEIDSGSTYRFGVVHIEGLKRYQPKIIENLNPIKPGDIYRQSSLLKFQTRLQESGYFRNVEVFADTTPENTENAPIHVIVEENSAIKVGVGAGYSTNTGARVQLSMDHLNLLNRGWRLSSSMELEQKEQSLNALIRLPTDKHNIRDSLNAGLIRTAVQGQTTITGHAGVNRSWGLRPMEQTVGLNYYIEHETLDGAPSTMTQVITASYGITLRHTDNELAPTKGYLFNAQFALAPFDMLSGGSFLQSNIKVQGYFPLTRSTQLITRGEIGIVVGSNRTPVSFLFRAGGDQSVRGYSYQSLGVKEADAITGGRYMATGSLEIVQWLTERWGVAAFIDFGNAGNNLQDLSPVFGYGLGARWKSPVGPLGADIAYGAATKGFQFHFNLGVTF